MQGTISKKNKIRRLKSLNFKITKLQYSGQYRRIELRFQK